MNPATIQKTLLPVALTLITGWLASRSFCGEALINLPPAEIASSPNPTKDAMAYVLQAKDVVQVSVYQEDDMGAKARLEKDGTILLPLAGKVQLGGKTLEEASRAIRDLLGKDYLVHPEVSVTVLEYAKRRFTILGQVQRPGSYEVSADESLNLLQAIAMAGGYTRIGAPSRVTVQRRIKEETKTFKLDAEAMSKDKNVKPFDIQPDDTITIGERIL
jgi:protein involved in polysaccharide export with SLBB domain